MRGLLASVTALLLSASAAAGAGEVKFAAKPRAAKAGGKVKITFSASAKTDCAVYILDAKGKVVRHLAAGVLGNKAPAPLKKGLAQTLEWDGKDDLGKPASGGPFKVRVGLGLAPKFEKMIGDNPAALGGVCALAVRPGSGELYVFHRYGQLHPSDNTTFCVVYTREGKYLCTIMPYPASLPETKLKGLKRIDVDGRKVPYIYQGETRSLIPGLGNLPITGPAVAADGRVAFVGHQEVGTYNQAGTGQVVFVNGDGSPPTGGVLGPVLIKSSNGGGNLAFAPDGKTVYATGMSGRRGKSPVNCVYKFAWGGQKAAVFAGDPKASGAGNKLNAPRSVATDGKGNVYVADRGNGRVAVFKADGSLLGALKVANPDQVQVHPKTGAVYLTAGTKGNRKLLKFSSWKSTAPACQMKVPLHRKDDISMLALDASAEPPILWYGHARSKWTGNFKALRIQDKGNSFSDAGSLAKVPGNSGGLGPVLMIVADHRSNRLFANGKMYDPATGKLGPGLGQVIKGSGGISDIGTKRGTGSVGLDGNIYLMGYSNWLARYGPDLKLKPYPTGKKGMLASPDDQGTLRLRARGVTADAAGNVYALWQMNKKGPLGPSNYLAVHGADGKVRNAKLIECQTRFINSPRLDYQGNVYVAVTGRPAGKKLPKSFDGQDLGKSYQRGVNPVGADWYEMMYGCILKFGPAGGSIKRGGGGDLVIEYGRTSRSKYTRKLGVKGAKWAFHGASPVPGWEDGGGRVSCGCESPRFDVDGFGRSFFPDAARFRVGVIDTGGNEICWFGSYGNADSAGPKSKVPTPDIPMLWPYGVAVGAGAVYVGDRLNRRVVAVKLKYSVEESCEIR